MAITLTTLDIEDGTDQTMTLLGKDLQSSKWLNATGSNNKIRQELTVKQSVSPATKTAPRLRRILASYTRTQTVASDGTTPLEGPPEVLTVNMTIVHPEASQAFTTLVTQNCVAIMRNFMTAAVVAQLENGEV